MVTWKNENVFILEMDKKFFQMLLTTIGKRGIIYHVIFIIIVTDYAIL